MKQLLKKGLYMLPQSWIKRFYQAYNLIRYPNMREQKKSFGTKNPDKIFYVIRPRTDCVEGLMSLLLNVVKQISYAEMKGYIPVVDFENYRTQYSDDTCEEKNVWLRYFDQVSDYSLAEVYQSRNVVLSGLNALAQAPEYLDQKMDSESLQKAQAFVAKHIRFSDAVEAKVAEETVCFSPEQTLGLYLRGTDYIKLKPAGHPVQPLPEQAIEITDQKMKEHQLKKVFLVTEDAEIYQKIKARYQENLLIVSYDQFMSGYDGKTFLSKNGAQLSQLANDAYTRGLNYLCKLILLSRCKCFVGGNTCGSWAANCFGDRNVDRYVFDLGSY